MNRLLELRTSRGYSQVEMAKLLSVARPTYTKYETGDIQLMANTLLKLSHIFGVSIDYILCNDAYVDTEDGIDAIREDMRRDPGLRTLWSIQRKANKTQVQRMQDFARGVVGGDEYDETDTP